jgi:hypothetical protein
LFLGDCRQVILSHSQGRVRQVARFLCDRRASRFGLPRDLAPGAGAQWGYLGIAHVGARADRGPLGMRAGVYWLNTAASGALSEAHSCPFTGLLGRVR